MKGKKNGRPSFDPVVISIDGISFIAAREAFVLFDECCVSQDLGVSGRFGCYVSETEDVSVEECVSGEPDYSPFCVCDSYHNDSVEHEDQSFCYEPSSVEVCLSGDFSCGRCDSVDSCSAIPSQDLYESDGWALTDCCDSTVGSYRMDDSMF